MFSLNDFLYFGILGFLSGIGLTAIFSIIGYSIIRFTKMFESI